MFTNREEAGKLLAENLQEYKDRDDTIVFAIPRGGVAVAYVVVKNLHLPLTVVVVRKLGAPGNPELAIGAIAPDNVKVIDENLVAILGVGKKYLDEEIEIKRKELEERMEKFGIKNKERPEDSRIKNNKIIIIVDDGIATGATTLAAIKYIKKGEGESGKGKGESTLNASRFTLTPYIILAVPVIARDTYDKLKSEVDRIVALEIPESFGAVGEFYREFPQVTDEEVEKYLETIGDRK